MEFTILNKKQKSLYSSDILNMMEFCDNDFVPPLSKRKSTTQSNLTPGAEDCYNSGITYYHEEMMKQEILAAVLDEKLLGFVSFKENMSFKNIKTKDIPNIYISTLILHPNARGKGITAKMYDYLFNVLFLDRNIYTRTWSTNTAHIKILNKFGFKEIDRITDDRGEGIDTVYFALQRL